MKVLSVQIPWAIAVICGEGEDFKDVENRRWSTPYRGRIAIQASKQVDWDAPRWVWLAAGLTPPPALGSFVKKNWVAGLPLGLIIGDVELYDIVVGSRSRWAQRGGCWHWLLREPRAYRTPVPWKGAVGRLGDWDGQVPALAGA